MEKELRKGEGCNGCEESGSPELRSKRKPSGRVKIKTEHPDHSASLKRLNRIRGQLDAVSRMIEEQKYCLDILQQVRAASSALRGLESEILRGHLKGCVQSAFTSKKPFAASEKIEEIIALWSK